MAKIESWLDKGIVSLSEKHDLKGKAVLKNVLSKKMSEVLLEFAMPLLEGIDTSDECLLRATLTVAVTVWNYSILKQSCGSNQKTKLQKKLTASAIASGFRDPIGQEVLRVLLERKTELFPG